MILDADEPIFHVSNTIDYGVGSLLQCLQQALQRVQPLLEHLHVDTTHLRWYDAGAIAVLDDCVVLKREHLRDPTPTQ